jgi:glycosyltransferase involved in cell wall biosynthesis
LDNSEFSVIIPTYYRPDCLVDLFESISKQTLKPLEVIVVDDTPISIIKVKCEEYEAKFEVGGIELVYIKNPKDRSIAIARNIGIDRSKGGLIMFLDSDAVLFPDYMEKILDVFREYRNVVGVQGWRVEPRMTKDNSLMRSSRSVYRSFFRLQRHVRNSCKFAEYPYVLTKVINCEYLKGSNLTVKRDIMSFFRFDENLKKYSYLEDLLLSYSIHRLYPNSLYITPYAKYIHKTSEEGRMEKTEESKHLRQCRKYVLIRLFGAKGSFIYCWQTIGILIFHLIRKAGISQRKLRE